MNNPLVLPMTSVTDYLAVALVLGVAFGVRFAWTYWRAHQ